MRNSDSIVHIPISHARSLYLVLPCSLLYPKSIHAALHVRFLLLMCFYICVSLPSDDVLCWLLSCLFPSVWFPCFFSGHVPGLIWFRSVYFVITAGFVADQLMWDKIPFKCHEEILYSLWSHLNVLTFSPLTGGCSEGLDAFIFFFEQVHSDFSLNMQYRALGLTFVLVNFLLHF